MTALVLDPVFKEHLTGDGHPERPDRYDAVTAALAHAGHLDALPKLPTRKATDEDLLRCHTKPYIEVVKRDVASGRTELSTGDTTISARSLDVALLAAGGVLNAVDAVIGGKAKNAFCVVRPPGHHARPAQGMGFCLFNSVAVAARYAQSKHKAGKVMIADWDVHHGNGTQDIFYRDGSVFFFSTHQSPWYPGTGMEDETGEGAGLGSTMNCPFPAGAGRKEILGVFEARLAKSAEKFKPDFVLLSAGFDSRLGDPLGRFRLTDEDFRDLTKVMLNIAKAHAGGRLVSVLEGGYSLSGLAAGVTAHVDQLRKGP
ncbi:MAG: histone deacetylase family protein [Bryobacteraceae bacterium]